MIKLLVVEDEASTRNGLLKHINWDEMGIDIIEEARDGIEGLNVASRFKPDIIISDIRMPKMNGINFSTHIRQHFPKCQIIFLSGYSDKEYLKAAINLGVVSYVEKPINLDEIKSVVSKTVELLQKEKEEIKAQNTLNSAFSHNLPYIKQNIALKLVSEAVDLEEILSELKLAGVPFKENELYTASIILPSFSAGTSDEARRETCHKAVRCLEMKTNHFVHIAAVKDLTHIISVSMHRHDTMDDELFSVFSELKNCMLGTDSFCENLSWIAGKPVKGLSKVRHSYEDAQNSLGKLFFIGHGSMLSSIDKGDSSYQMDQDVLTDLSAMLENPSENIIKAYTENLCDNLKRNLSTPVDDIKNIFFQMIAAIASEAGKRGLKYEHYPYLGEKHLWGVISKTKTLLELKNYLMQNIELFMRGVASVGTKSKAIIDAMDYIKENYGKVDLTVIKIASYVYLTPTYLSALFKKETGKTVSEFITEVRISKSLEYIADHRIKLYEIAHMTGYSDANYYSKAFKKMKGMTPSQFRKKYKS